MGALHTSTRMLDATRPDPFAPIPAVAVRCCEPDPRLATLHALDRAWTADEWAYASECEFAAGEREG